MLRDINLTSLVLMDHDVDVDIDYTYGFVVNDGFIREGCIDGLLWYRVFPSTAINYPFAVWICPMIEEY